MPETPEMVKKVAKALAAANSDGDWHPWLDDARVAIQAMREPGAAVIAAVENKAEERYNAAPDMQRWYGEDVWAAGIDAALAAPEEGREP